MMSDKIKDTEAIKVMNAFCIWPKTSWQQNIVGNKMKSPAAAVAAEQQDEAKKQAFLALIINRQGQYAKRI